MKKIEVKKRNINLIVNEFIELLKKSIYPTQTIIANNINLSRRKINEYWNDVIIEVNNILFSNKK